MINKLKKQLDFIFGKKLSILLFFWFLVINLYYFVSRFFLFFLNNGSNGDEYYQYNLYTVTSFSVNNVFYTPSQPFIFLSSFVDYFLRKPIISTRIVSLIVCIGLILFFIKKIKAIQSDSSIERVYKITLFICAIFITNQMYHGTSDFLSFVFLVPPFLIILDSISLKKINLSNFLSILIGFLFAFSIATRPTAIILIGLFYCSIFLILGFKSIFCKENFIIFLNRGFDGKFLKNFPVRVGGAVTGIKKSLSMFFLCFPL
jgi:hypothetical protein